MIATFLQIYAICLQLVAAKEDQSGNVLIIK